MEIDDEISKLKKEKAAAEDALQAFKKKTKVFFDQKTKQVEVLTITLIQSNDIDLVACL
jgi:ribosome recycling factor